MTEDISNSNTHKDADEGGFFVKSEGFLTPPPLLTMVVEDIEKIYGEHSSSLLGISTGFDDLDRATSGFQPGNLIVVAGAPSIGKTTFAMNIAQHISVAGKRPVAIFCMEMTEKQLISRMLSAEGRINHLDLCYGRLIDADWGKLTHALGKLHAAPFIFSPAANAKWTVSSFRERLLEIRDEGVEISLIVIDSVQHLDVDSFVSSYDRNIQLTEQIRQIKKMALEFGVPVILTSPLSREFQSRTNKRPVLNDLRDIGILEYMADLVLFIYRDEADNKDSLDTKLAEINIAKNSNGPVGYFQLAFQPQYFRFDNLASKIE